MAVATTSNQSQNAATPCGSGLDQVNLERLLDSAIVFWRGTSGQAYVHAVYSLARCPPVPPASILLVDNQASDCRVVLDVIGVDHVAPSLSLVEIRRIGAELGASEVHVRFAYPNAQTRQTAVADLRTRYAGVHVAG